MSDPEYKYFVIEQTGVESFEVRRQRVGTAEQAYAAAVSLCEQRPTHHFFVVSIVGYVKASVTVTTESRG